MGLRRFGSGSCYGQGAKTGLQYPESRAILLQVLPCAFVNRHEETRKHKENRRGRFVICCKCYPVCIQRGNQDDGAQEAKLAVCDLVHALRS